MERGQNVSGVEDCGGSVRAYVIELLVKKSLDDLANKRCGESVDVPPSRNSPPDSSIAPGHDIDNEPLCRAPGRVHRLRTGRRCIANVF